MAKREPIQQIQNTAKITPDFCVGKNLVFYPATLEDTMLLQRRMFDSGFRWPNGSDHFNSLEFCREHGMNIHNGDMYAGTVFTKMGNTSVKYTIEDESENSPIFVCTIDQFDDKYLPSDRAFMTQLFNALAAQNTALEKKITTLAEELAEVKKMLGPQTLDKPPLKGPNP